MNKTLELEEQDFVIQNMSVAELRSLKRKSVEIDNDIIQIDNEDEEYLDIDFYIQQLQLSELKKIVENSFLLKNINEDSLLHKTKLTGLDRNIVLLVENCKEKATLQQIITYCTKLNIPFKKFLPELYL